MHLEINLQLINILRFLHVVMGMGEPSPIVIVRVVNLK
jgi:hypothetical protein